MSTWTIWQWLGLLIGVYAVFAVLIPRAIAKGIKSAKRDPQ